MTLEEAWANFDLWRARYEALRSQQVSTGLSYAEFGYVTVAQSAALFHYCEAGKAVLELETSDYVKAQIKIMFPNGLTLP